MMRPGQMLPLWPPLQQHVPDGRHYGPGRRACYTRPLCLCVCVCFSDCCYVCVMYGAVGGGGESEDVSWERPLRRRRLPRSFIRASHLGGICCSLLSLLPRQRSSLPLNLLTGDLFRDSLIPHQGPPLPLNLLTGDLFRDSLLPRQRSSLPLNLLTGDLFGG